MDAMAVGVLILIVLVFVSKKMYFTYKEQNEKVAKEKAFEQEMSSYATYSYPILTLKERTPHFSRAIKICDDTNAIMDYDPVRYIYTSATVGEIKTGGVDKIGGHVYKAGEVSTGKCVMQYFGKKIDAIQLTDALYKEAKKSKIAEFLNDKKQILIDTGADVSLLAASAVYDMKSPTGSLVLQNLAKAGYPTYGKCVAIMDWLCKVEKNQ